MKVRIFVEGGGDNGFLITRCREGFTKFFATAGFRGRMPKVVPCGGRGATFDRFCEAVKNTNPNEIPLLLVDSEAPVTTDPWMHVMNREGDRWIKPSGASDDQIFLMVQLMESWFLADRDALQRYYKQGFKVDKLPLGDNIETIPKAQVQQGLKSATKETKTKGEYSKGSHSFDLLGLIDPHKVRQASPHAARLFRKLESILS